MRHRLPISLIVVAAMFCAITPAFAVPRNFDGGPTRGIEDRNTAQATAPASDFTDRPTAAMGQIPSTAQTTGADVIVYGGGWGHGIGMSQWGAQAMAVAESNHEQILSHFYTGAQFGQIAPAGQIVQHGDPDFVHVGVGPNRISVSFVPVGGTGELCVPAIVPGADGTIIEERCFTANIGEQWFMYGPRATANPGQTCLITMKANQDSNTPQVAMAEMEVCEGTLTWGNQPATRMYFPGIGKTFARGSIDFTPILEGDNKDLLHVTVVATMDEYLYGLGEVPNTWHPEALRAQVVAARTFALYRIYAVRNNPGGLRADCACQLLATTADQSYLGWSTNGLTEGDANTANGAKWKAAVDGTSGKALWHTKHGPTRALEAYYFSSSGGNTENNEDRWGGSAYEYLRSRPDPGATSWEKSFTYQGFAAALGFQTVTWVEIPERYQSGRPKSLVIHGTKGGQATIETFTPGAFATALGLLSQTVHHISGFLPEGADRVVLHNPNTGQWTMRQASGQTVTFYFGNPGDLAIFGDWDGDGVSTVGIYRQSDGYVYLRNSNTQGFADNRFYFGIPGDVPVVGDFDGDGFDTVSIYRPSEQKFYITNRLGNDNKGFFADYSFVFGEPGDLPFAGDWDGDGIDTPALRRPSDGYIYLRNSNMAGPADIVVFFGLPGDILFSGDWNGDGVDGLGAYRPGNAMVYLKNGLTGGQADYSYLFGTPAHRPVAGPY